MSSTNRLVRALYDFESEMDDEMAVKEGELLLVRPGEGESWLFALKLENSTTSKMGLVPASFVEDIIEELTGKSVNAKYGYEGRDENELTVDEGENLMEFYSGEEWSVVKSLKGIIGLVPKNYLIEENSTQETLNNGAVESFQHEDGHGEESTNEPCNEAEESGFIDIGSPNIPSAPPMPSSPESLDKEEKLNEEDEKATRQMPSVILNQNDLKDNMNAGRTKSTNKNTSSSNNLEKMISDSEKRLEEITMYEADQKNRKAQEQTPKPSAKWIKDSSPKVIREEDIVKATPPPKSDAFQLPPINLKKASEREESAKRSHESKVKGPMLTESGYNRDAHNEGMSLAIRKSSVKLENHPQSPSTVNYKSPKEGKSSPKVHEYRIWSDSTGQNKIEARYFGMEENSVVLINRDNRAFTISMNKLCTKDIEYICSQEGLPVSDFKVEGFDWLKFVLEAGIEPKKAVKYAGAIAKEKFNLQDASEITKRWMERKDFEAIDIILLEKSLSSLNKSTSKESPEDDALKKKMEELEQKLEEIDRNKSQPNNELVAYPTKSRRKSSKNKVLRSADEEEEIDLPPQMTKLIKKMSDHRRPSMQEFINEKGIRRVIVQEESFNNESIGHNDRSNMGYGQSMIGGSGPMSQPNYHFATTNHGYQNMSQPMMMPPQPPAQIVPVMYMPQQPPPPPPPQIAQPIYYMQPPPPPPPPPQAYYYPQQPSYHAPPPPPPGGYYYRY